MRSFDYSVQSVGYSGQKPFYLGLLGVAVLLVASLLFRLPDFEKVTGSQNLEASYHVLITINALNESGVQNHWLLPTISLGNELDKNIAWGATIPTRTGDYVYTSFTPYGFLAPYLALKAFGQDISLESLALFNVALSGLIAFMLFGFLFDILRFNGLRAWPAAAGALLGSVIALFSREALLSHGVIYWVHSFYQLVLLSSLFVLFKYLSATDSRSRTHYAWALCALVFFGALTEWTGYFFNFGVFCILWLNTLKIEGSRLLAKKVFIATFLSGVITILHYSLAAGLLPTLKAFARRFLARSASAGSNPLDLLQGYILSYGYFIAALALAGAMLIWAKKHQATHSRAQAVTWVILIAAAVPLLENVIMLQHATQFSFDRLKFIFPAALILALSFIVFQTKGRAAMAALVAFAAVQGCTVYKNDIATYAAWTQIDHENKQLVALVAQELNTQCAVLSTDMSVRGYANLLFHRGIHELRKEPVDFRREAGACGGVYLQGKDFQVDLPEYTKATVIESDNRTVVFVKDQHQWRRTN
ncbi:hypothetical protein IQ22_00927 [Pseudomonas duriflava]|uniref:Glycosyltransferase RgtA/B/C/D-like domain-containing protein n=1 Tax=Pseudomonas duriflava TaxID=459528 RepID=A0A562QI82_9PSED|nr:hypothetical protein [Pseudomonas duriflava]TWI56478.1 hypothetical protein IQ22_00927 [Pseudomonas duriflava]